MPLYFRIDEQADLVVTKAGGTITGDDLLEHARALADTPNRPLRELVDFSDPIQSAISTNDVREAAWLLSDEDESAPGARLALVATSDPIFGMLRVFQVYREHSNIQIRVYRERDDAMRWLFSEDDSSKRSS